MFTSQSEMRKIIMIPSRSGLFRPFNVIFFVLFTVRVFKFVLLFFIHTGVMAVFRVKFSIRKYNQVPKKFKFQYFVLFQTEKTVKSYELFHNPLGTVIFIV